VRQISETPECGWSLLLTREFRRGFLARTLYLEDEPSHAKSQTELPRRRRPQSAAPELPLQPNSVGTQTTRISMHLHRGSAGSAAGIG
jgi:hypothetical protein